MPNPRARRGDVLRKEVPFFGSLVWRRSSDGVHDRENGLGKSRIDSISVTDDLSSLSTFLFNLQDFDLAQSKHRTCR